MNQFTNFDSKHYARSARNKEPQEKQTLGSHLDESLDNETNTFDMASSNRKNKSLLGRSKNSGAWCPANDLGDMEKTGSKIFQASFSHHDPNNCVCDVCNCGRHLCKFHVVKPDLSKGSVYAMSYDRK